MAVFRVTKPAGILGAGGLVHFVLTLTWGLLASNSKMRFRYSTGQSSRDYVWLSKGISLPIKASTSSRPSATSSAIISFS